MGLVMVGAVSTGGLAALAVNVSGKNEATEIIPNLEGRNSQNDNRHGR
jgi:hypothetical protein